MSDLLSPASEGSNRSSPAMHILHVEDNLGDIVLFREALRPFSLSVKISVATNGEEALRILHRESPAASGSPIDLIL
jgi:CheY-like chemotaxis protein